MYAKHLSFGLQRSMGTSAITRSRTTPESIRRRIQGAKITDVDKEVLDAELDVLMSDTQLSIEQASTWIAESIQVRESTMTVRAEIEREMDAAFAATHP